MVDRPKKPSAIPVSPIAPSAQVKVTNGRVTASLPTGESVEVLLYGATVISWKSAGGKENLFLSTAGKLDGSKAVRGGIPLVFPNFGPPPPNHATSKLPQHGFARISTWEYLGKTTSESDPRPDSTGDDSVKLDFGLTSSSLDEASRKAWPYQFGLEYSVTLGKNGLETSLVIRNEGKESFDFECLMHTYLKVDDVRNIQISGLKGKEYTDKVDNLSTKTENNEAVTITSETDRVYKSLNPASPVRVLEGGAPKYQIVRDNLEDVVVWNPWVEKAAGMADFGPKDGWKNMICIEAGSVAQFQKLDAGDTFEGSQVIITPAV